MDKLQQVKQGKTGTWWEHSGWGLEHLCSEERLRELGFISWRIDGFVGTQKQPAGAYREVPGKTEPDSAVMAVGGQETTSLSSEVLSRLNFLVIL